MNDQTLEAFRRLGDVLIGTPQRWEWVGPHMSQRMFGITEQRAKEYAKLFGGTARRMED